MPRDAYDELPYTDHAYAESHPDRLAVVATLAGWDAPALRAARVLELACGRGGNLLPMAASLPEATFVGVDRSEVQIVEAARIATAAGIANVALQARPFEEAELPGGSFDYVIAHGLCSWVPPATRRALLAVVARALAPRGVAYVSFNVLPGWYTRMAVRDWLAFTQDVAGPAGSVAWLAAQVSPELGAYRDDLRAVAQRLRETDRAYAVHEYFEAEHHPQTLSELAAEARAAGLAFAGDAIPSQTAVDLLPEAAAERARGLGALGAQQLADFVRNTSFRRAVFVRADTAAARLWSLPSALDPSAMQSLRLASRLRPSGDHAGGGPEMFTCPAGTVQVTDPAARRALRELWRVAPASLSFEELAGAADAAFPTDHEAARDPAWAALASELFDVWISSEGLALHAFEPPLVRSASERPVANRVARWHAVNGGPLTNAWHEEVRLAEPLVRFLLGRLDGTRDAAALVQDAAGALPGAPVTPSDLQALVRGALDLLAGSALLVG